MTQIQEAEFAKECLEAAIKTRDLRYCFCGGKDNCSGDIAYKRSDGELLCEACATEWSHKRFAHRITRAGGGE